MFPIRLLGYDRSEVEGELARLRAEIDMLKTALNEATDSIEDLQVQLEDTSIRLAAARRDRVLAMKESTLNGVPITLIIGPARTFAALVPLVDDLEDQPGLSIQFRVYRDGIYRVEATAHETEELKRWLKVQLRVRNVTFEDSTFHVLMKE